MSALRIQGCGLNCLSKLVNLGVLLLVARLTLEAWILALKEAWVLALKEAWILALKVRILALKEAWILALKVGSVALRVSSVALMGNASLLAQRWRQQVGVLL